MKKVIDYPKLEWIVEEDHPTASEIAYVSKWEGTDNSAYRLEKREDLDTQDEEIYDGYTPYNEKIVLGANLNTSKSHLQSNFEKLLQKSMTYSKAMEAILRGNKVYREGWPDNVYLRLYNGVITNQLTQPAKFGENSLKGNWYYWFPLVTARMNVQAKPRTHEDIIHYLMTLLDDIDTASDAYKDKYKGYQKYVMRALGRRWHTGIETDGYSFKLPSAYQKSDHYPPPKDGTVILAAWKNDKYPTVCHFFNHKWRVSENCTPVKDPVFWMPISELPKEGEK